MDNIKGTVTDPKGVVSKLTGEITFPTAGGGAGGSTTTIAAPVGFEAASGNRTLADDEIAIVTYWHAPTEELARTCTVHYGPKQTIRESLGASGNSGNSQMGLLAGYIIKLK